MHTLNHVKAFEQLSTFIPKHSKCIVDLGSGDGDGPATTARMLPDAKVVAVEASPFYDNLWSTSKSRLCKFGIPSSTG